MKIAIIGAGNVGTTLGRAWQRHGHEIAYGVRQADDGRYSDLGADATDNATAVADADVVALCDSAGVWWPAYGAADTVPDLAGAAA